MTIQSSGPISFSQINTELGFSYNTQLSLSAAESRTLSGVASGQLSMSNFYGKSNVFSVNISSNLQELNLRTWALANGWNGTSAVNVTVNSDVYIWSDNTANPALTINGSWPNGVTVTNNGYIMGKGGDGGGVLGSTAPATNGGPAISLGINASIVNNSYIGGGGGGGAGLGGGGGAGGGTGGTTADGIRAGGYGGSGGLIGNTGSNSAVVYGGTSAGGGGGRIMPGTGGAGAIRNAGDPTWPDSYAYSAYGGGAGGGSGAQIQEKTPGWDGKAGGSGGSAGEDADHVGDPYGDQRPPGGGGGWGASGGGYYFPYFPGIVFVSGGTGGKAIALNGYTATRSGAGTTYGAVS